MKVLYMSLFALMLLQSTASTIQSGYASKDDFHEKLSSNAMGSKSRRLTRRVYISEEEELTPRAARVRRKLGYFIDELKVFVRDLSFDYENFDLKSKDLRLHLSNVEAEVANLPFTYSIAKQLVYAKGVYELMLLSARIAMVYCHGNHEQILLRKVTQLNMGLFYLQDSHGDPNTEMEENAETVHRLMRVVNYMRELYEQMKNVSIDLHENLRTQLEKAESNLLVLSLPIWFLGMPVYMGDSRTS